MISLLSGVILLSMQFLRVSSHRLQVTKYLATSLQL